MPPQLRTPVCGRVRRVYSRAGCRVWRVRETSRWHHVVLTHVRQPGCRSLAMAPSFHAGLRPLTHKVQDRSVAHGHAAVGSSVDAIDGRHRDDVDDVRVSEVDFQNGAVVAPLDRECLVGVRYFAMGYTVDDVLNKRPTLVLGHGHSVGSRLTLMSDVPLTVYPWLLT